MNMTATLSDEDKPLIETIAHACAITFQGNASNNLQQDAFFFLDHWYQEDLGVMAVTSVQKSPTELSQSSESIPNHDS